MNIDEIAQNIVSSFKSGNNEMLKQETKKMLHQMDYDESMFSVVKRPYLVAKSLYFMLTQDYLTEDEQMSTIKLCYFCLLKNYLQNVDKRAEEPEYENLVCGCKLALVLLSMQNQFLTFSVIAGLGLFVNPQTHVRNQVFLFAGIAKEADDAKSLFHLEDVINDYYVDIYKELNSHVHIPIGRELTMLKESCTPVVKDIERDIRINFKESPDWMDF